MANQFTVRVELHGAITSDYEKLHLEMEKIGFLRTIIQQGKSYWLPQGEYIGDVTLTGNQVCDKVVQIATLISKEPSVLVSAVGDRVTRNLKLVR